MEVWLGGHSRGGLVAWHATPMARASGLVLVDPVSGGGPPWHAPEPPPPSSPTGRSPSSGSASADGALPGRNHETFAEALPAAGHVVVEGVAHADILDGPVGRFGRITCGHAPDTEVAARAARDAVLEALDGAGALG